MKPKHTRFTAGKKGGLKTSATHGREHFATIGRKGGKSRPKRAPRKAK